MAEFAIAHNRVTITPVKDVVGRDNPWMAGWWWSPRGNRYYLANRQLVADCAVIKPTTGDPLIIVRVDVVSVPPSIYRAVRDYVVSKGYTNAASFLLVSSHTHSGPALPEQPDPYVQFGITGTQLDKITGYGNWLTAQFKTLVDNTMTKITNEPVPVNLSYGEGTFDISLIYNRTGENTLINSVPVLLARRADTNAPALALFGATAHPVCRGAAQVYDSDYPGVATAQLESSLNCPAMFFLGCAGDHNPNRTGDVGAVTETGNAVGNAALAKINSGTMQAVAGPVSTQLQISQLPLEVNLADPAVRQTLINYYTTSQNGQPPEGDVSRFCRSMVTKLNNNAIPAAVQLPMMCWKFGTNFAIMALGGEPVSNYHVALRGSTTRRLWVMGYSNEIPCYVPHDRTLWHRPDDAQAFYESGWSGTNLHTGFGSSMQAYGWPAPLRSSKPVDVPTAQPGSAEYALMQTGKALLGPSGLD